MKTRNTNKAAGSGRHAVALLAAVALLSSGAPSSVARGLRHPTAHNGQIAFARQASDDPDSGHNTYVVDPSSRHLQATAHPADFPRWSPDGRYLAVGDMPCMFGGACAAVLVRVRDGAARTLPDPAPQRFDEFFGCTAWSPSGDRLACGGLGSAPGASGVYTVRTSNGQDLTRVISCDNECGPADYSPDGQHLSLVGNDDHGVAQLWTIRIDGTRLHQVTRDDMPIDVDSSASWSPLGGRLLFTRQADDAHRRAIFEVDIDGSDVHQVPIPECGGAFDTEGSVGCFGASWSPDGKQIVYAHLDSASGIQDIYTAKANGNNPHRVTHDTSGLPITTPDWGPRPAW